MQNDTKPLSDARLHKTAANCFEGALSKSSPGEFRSFCKETTGGFWHGPHSSCVGPHSPNICMLGRMRKQVFVL